MDTESYQSTTTKALVLTVIYIFSPACLITTQYYSCHCRSVVSLGFNHRHNRPKQAAHLSNDAVEHHHFSTLVLVDFMGLVGVENIAVCLLS